MGLWEEKEFRMDRAAAKCVAGTYLVVYAARNGSVEVLLELHVQVVVEVYHLPPLGWNIRGAPISLSSNIHGRDPRIGGSRNRLVCTSCALEIIVRIFLNTW